MVQPDRLVRFVKRLANGASAGPSGWTGELLLALVDDSECLRGLVHLFQDLVAGDVPPRLHAVLRASFLSALAKPGSSTPRPVANGEVFTKLAALLALDTVSPRLGEIFAEIQLGIGKAGGSERAMHVIQSWIHAPGGYPLLISADVSNAFNCRNRAHVLTALFSHDVLSPLFPFVFWLYG